MAKSPIGYAAMALRRREDRVHEIAHKQVRGIGVLRLRGYWPERNEQPLFEVTSTAWMSVDDARWLRDRLNSILPEADDRG